MASKNTICLWYDGTALDAARFYAETFPIRSAYHQKPQGEQVPHLRSAAVLDCHTR
jgi:predicted 3-demethylubiquinone-9 3-methyltransferase (glyoxalase superfamily)